MAAFRAGPAFAFTIDTPLSDGCHERMTLAALELAGWPEGSIPPALNEMERRILEDLPFEIPESARNPWAIALLVGVRHNDLKGVAPSDLPGLSAVHGDPKLQSEHCLRSPIDDGDPGDRSAIASCRSLISKELSAALGTSDRIDLEATVLTEVNLAFRGEIEIPVRRFGFHAGRALHALQDSYSHTFRAPADERIRHVLNFVDSTRSSDYSESKDGHAHVTALDVCDDSDGPAGWRTRAAVAASIDLLRALADGAGGRSGRIERLQGVLDRRLSLEEGCTATNRWCDAAELALMPDCACQEARPLTSRGRHGLALLALLFAGALVLGRRRLGVALCLLLLASPALASEVRTSSRTIDQLGLYVGGSASLDRGAFALAGGVRVPVFQDLTLGLDAEINPWFSLDAARLAPGALNIYFTGIYHWFSLGRVELRTTAHIGTSVLLFDLVGAEAGSTGLYFGLNLLGVAIRVSDHFQLVLEPADLSFPIPHLWGVPFYYRQYRLTFGLEWNP